MIFVEIHWYSMVFVESSWNSSQWAGSNFLTGLLEVFFSEISFLATVFDNQSQSQIGKGLREVYTRMVKIWYKFMALVWVIYRTHQTETHCCPSLGFLGYPLLELSKHGSWRRVSSWVKPIVEAGQQTSPGLGHNQASKFAFSWQEMEDQSWSIHTYVHKCSVVSNEHLNESKCVWRMWFWLRIRSSPRQ